jgi:hypothetical protein
MVHAAGSAQSLLDDYRNQGGWGYNNRAWRESDTIQYLRQHPALRSTCTLYTDGPDPAYLLAGVSAAMSPARSMSRTSDISGLKGLWPGTDRACLIWFDVIQRDYLFDVDELRTLGRTERLVRLQDGAVYVIAR